MSTPDEEMERLSARIDKLETMWLSEIKDINAKLSQMAVSNASRKECPSPGSCIILRADTERLLKWIAEHDRRIQSLERWQSSLVAGFALLTIVVTLFAPSIRAMFRLP